MKRFRFVRSVKEELILTEDDILKIADEEGIEIQDDMIDTAWDIFESLNLDDFDEFDDQVDIYEE